MFKEKFTLLVMSSHDIFTFLNRIMCIELF